MSEPVMVTGTRTVTENVEGKRVATHIAFLGQQLHLGAGRFEVHSEVAELDENGNTIGYADPVQRVHKVNSITPLLAYDYDDGQGGTVTGLQMFNGFIDLCQRVWKYEIDEDGNIVEQ